MSRIHVLAPEVADRIAAGEVVERPAAVVRELLDNALDAGASRIEIDLEAGGIDLVRVADDGCGMDPDDARLAFERHATSKIRSGDDLDDVRTLGFRGEALAAIAAVSRVELLTRAAEGGGAGTRVVVERGRRVVAEPAARAAGTTLAVEGLFDGIPARKKFLKAPGTELEHCLSAVMRAALARWSVGFHLRHAGREFLAAAPASEPGPRITDVLGSRWYGGLVPVSERRGALAVDAWVGRSDVHRPTRDGLHLFVNARPVRDPLLLRAVLDAYRAILPAGRFPVVVLYLALPPADVDVNVHPAKSEVRFHRPQDVRAAVLAALAHALGERRAVPYFGAAPPGPAPAAWGAYAADGLPPLETGPVAPGASPAPALPFDGELHDGTAPAPGPTVRALAQYRDCYVVAEDEQGLLIVDQHVAHERLLFEQLLAQADQGPLPRQVLLFPVTRDVGPERAELVGAHRDLLLRLGFAAEPFGPASVVVREVPAILGREASPETFDDVLERVRRGDRAGAEDLFRHLLATVACHSAVKKGMPLPLGKLEYILRGLAACASPSHCPHGRVIAQRVDLSALDRSFDRA